MTAKALRGVLIIGTILTLLSFDLPKGWLKAGSDPNKYDMRIDKGTGQDGKNSATIKSIDKNIQGFGTLMQNCLPTKLSYLGKRIRMSGYIKTKDVDNYTGFWLRIDQEGSKERLGFDNMYDRPINGTTDWKKYEIVLDVPENASNMAYGALLNGTGQVWFDNISFEVVDNTVPTTGISKGEIKKTNTPETPINLNFED